MTDAPVDLTRAVNQAWFQYQLERMGQPLETHQDAFVAGYLKGASQAEPRDRAALLAIAADVGSGQPADEVAGLQAHLERGARIAFNHLDYRTANRRPLSGGEAAWLEAERARIENHLKGKR